MSSINKDCITTLDLKHIQRKREYLFSVLNEKTEQTAFHTSEGKSWN